VTIARSTMTLCFPSRFMLVAAMNPCLCCFFSDSTRECRCTPGIIQRYLSKISGPLLDRIDIHIDVPAVPYEELRGNGACESSDEIRQRVERARAVQLARGYLNAEMPSSLIRKRCALDDAGERTLEMAVRKMGLSARTHDRILKVAAPSPIWMSRKLSRPSTWAKPCNTEASIVITGAEGRSGADVQQAVQRERPAITLVSSR